MLDIISMATLIIVFSSFAVVVTIIVIGGNMNKTEEEEEDELKEQAEYIRKYNENERNKINLMEFIKKIFLKLKEELKGRD